MGADRLLLIEDDATTREVLLLLLEADGWEVLAADSGTAALDILQGDTASPEVVLCDLHLPGVHGPQLAAKLRVLLPQAALLAMSASESGAGWAGYGGFLRKPFGPAEVRAALRALPIAEAGESAGEGERRTGGDDGSPVLAMPTFLLLERQMGARVKDLYGFALTDAEARLRRMEQSQRDGDLAAFAAEAHAIKGSAGMIGAERLRELASAAESGAVQGSHREKVQEMHLACSHLRLMLETFFPI